MGGDGHTTPECTVGGHVTCHLKYWLIPPIPPPSSFSVAHSGLRIGPGCIPLLSILQVERSEAFPTYQAPRWAFCATQPFGRFYTEELFPARHQSMLGRIASAPSYLLHATFYDPSTGGTPIGAALRTLFIFLGFQLLTL